MQTMERVTANSLLGKAVLWAISVVKADLVQGGAATNHVRREASISCGSPEQPALVNRFVTFLLDCMFGKMIMPTCKSIPAGKLNHP